MGHHVMSRKFRLVILRVPYKKRAFKFLSYLAIISVLNQPVVYSRYMKSRLSAYTLEISV